jgi:hypothetical protein
MNLNPMVVCAAVSHTMHMRPRKVTILMITEIVIGAIMPYNEVFDSVHSAVWHKNSSTFIAQYKTDTVA